MLKECKGKGLCWSKSSSARFEEVYSYILFLSLITNLITKCSRLSLSLSPLLFVASSSFYIIPPLIPTSHMYIEGLVLIFVPSALFISLHVVAVRLKHTVQISPPH